jgi:hypothetical protein
MNKIFEHSPRNFDGVFSSQDQGNQHQYSQRRFLGYSSNIGCFWAWGWNFFLYSPLERKPFRAVRLE